MKFTILLTLLTTLNVSAFVYSQDAKLNLSLQDKTLREVIKTIENQSNFRFFFSDDYLDLNKKVTVVAQDKGINEILPDLLEQSKVTYKVMENNVIVITPIVKQTNSISGTVTDGINGEVLIGVTLVIKGTTKVAVTDTNGKFSIDVSPGETLMVSYVGYIGQEIVVNDQKTLNIQLVQDVKQLEEIVVIGYGTVKKKDLTGSVTSVKSGDINSVRATNPLQVLQGKAAGVDMVQSSGQAGASLNITMRGNRSLLANNSPLILVDGIEYGSNLDLNPTDIESMDVLKDASSTAIYGTRGANGVILITTKKGVQGKSRITFSTYASYNVPSYIPKIMNSKQYMQKRLETLVADNEYDTYFAQGGATYSAGVVTWNQGTYPTPYNNIGTVTVDQLMQAKGYTNPYQLITLDPTALQLLNDGVSLDYLDLTFRNSWTQNYELGASGGNEKTTYSLSLGLMRDNGLLRNDNLDRYNFKIGLDHKLFKNVKVGSNILFSHKIQLKRDNGVFNQAIKTSPIGVLNSVDGSYTKFPDLVFTANQPNPMLDESPGAYKNDITSNRLFGTMYLTWDIIKGLTFKTNFGVDLNGLRDGLYAGPTSLKRVLVNTAMTQIQNKNSWNYTWENTLNYTKKLGKHEFTGLLGSSATANATELYQILGIGQQVGKTEFFDWNGSYTSVLPTSSYTASQMLSYFGRINYKFDEKYLLTASLRADGASVIAPDNRWGYFPSAAIAWRAKEESFLKSVDMLSNLKLRLSWGISGNSAVSPYQTLTQLGSTPAYYSFDGTTTSSLVPFSMGNLNVKWETTANWDLGLDFGILNNRITGTVDVYVSKTTDLLLSQPLPPSSVYTQVLSNVGSTKNKGIEVYLNTVNLKFKDFEWSTDWNLSANRDEVLSLNTGTSQIIYTDQNNNIQRIWRVGLPTVCYYDYYKLGVYQVSDLQAEYAYVAQQTSASAAIDQGKIPMIANKFLPGDLKLRDVNGDGVFNDADKVLYNNSPKATFGINNNITYKGFTLSAMIVGRLGQKIVYGLYQNYKSADLTTENGPYVNSWTPTSTGAEFPRYYTKGNAKSYNTSMTFKDGSYFKIRDITLSYSLPKSLLNKVHVSNLKIYATGKNLFTFSKIDNYDPEVGGTMNFPLAKQYILGMNLDF